MSLLRRSSSLIYQIFCDGASRSNPGDASIGVSISLDGKEIHTISRKIGIATNNEAEYQALIDGLNYCIENSIKEIEVFLDSNLVVEQVNKNYKVKAENLKVLNSKVDELIESLEDHSKKYHKNSNRYYYQV